jgi:hypothetical protein
VNSRKALRAARNINVVVPAGEDGGDDNVGFLLEIPLTLSEFVKIAHFPHPPLT